MSEFTDYIGHMGLNDPDLAPASGTFGVDPGTYGFEIVEAEVGNSRTGNPKLTLQSKVIWAQDPKMVGQIQYSTYSLKADSEFVRRRFLNLCMATGVPRDAKGGVKASAFVGCRYIGTVIEETSTETAPDGSDSSRTFRKIVDEKPFKPMANGDASQTQAQAQR